MTMALGLEILLAALLLLTVIYCWRLDRRLGALRNGTDGMRAAVNDLVSATERAQNCILALGQATTDSAAELEERSRSARRLAADLQRLERQARATLPLSAHQPAAHKTGLMDRLHENRS